MRIARHEVNLRYTKAELRAIFAQANTDDNDAMWSESETIGTFYFHCRT